MFKACTHNLLAMHSFSIRKHFLVDAFFAWLRNLRIEIDAQQCNWWTTLNWFQLLSNYHFVFLLLYIYLQNVSYNSFWKNVVKILFWSACSHMVCWSKLSNCSVMSNHMAWYLFSITSAEEHKPANGDI